MQHQKAVYLQEMGITRWQVRKPSLFSAVQDSARLDLSDYSLLVLCTESEFSHPLMSKILKAFNFSSSDTYHCSLAEFEAHQGQLPEYIWSTLGSINQLHGHKLLTSPPISQLAGSAQAKKILWEQFCAFEK